ncbi:uncharacterized protein LOC113361045 [Papaver somniferum]|nr:uncharacterized protein LOC113361045 [Papaver somniferum]
MQSYSMNSSVSYGPYIVNKPYTESSLFPKKNPFLCNFVPPNKLALKKQKPLIVKSSIKDLAKTSAVLTNQIFESLASFDTWVVRSLSNLIAFKPKANRLSSGFFEEGDLIQVNHDGNYIVGLVQHIGFWETTLIGPRGLIILQNFKIDKYSIETKTETVGNEKLFGFNTLLNCKTGKPYKFMKEIICVLEKNEIVKDNGEHNVVVNLPNNKIEVVCYVNSSKLQIPQFKSYLEISEQVFADIYNNIYKNKAVVDYLKYLVKSLVVH